MSVSVTEATRQRLAISKAVFGQPRVDLSILDKLSVPKNFDDLVMQIQAKDTNMFFPMTGMPMAFMEIPVWQGQYRDDGLGNKVPDYSVERWIYRVFHWWAKGTASKCEAALCEAAWKDFVTMRKEFAALYGDTPPLIVWRRQPEFEQERRPTRTRINLRFAIPGLQIEKYLHCHDGRGDAFNDHTEVVLEPIV